MKHHWKKTFNKDYLGSWDLEEGQQLNVVIEKTEVREVLNQFGEKQKCNVAILRGQKPMILNVTACKQMKRFTGSHFIEDWTNVPITLYVTETKAFGEVVEAIRISDKQPIKPVMKQGDKTWKKAVGYLSGGGELKNITDKYDVENINLLVKEAENVG